MNPRGGPVSGPRSCLAVAHRHYGSTFSSSWGGRGGAVYDGELRPAEGRLLFPGNWPPPQRCSRPLGHSVCVRPPPRQQHCQAAPSRTHMSALASLPPRSHEQDPARPPPQPVKPDLLGRLLTCGRWKPPRPPGLRGRHVDQSLQEIWGGDTGTGQGSDRIKRPVQSEYQQKSQNIRMILMFYMMFDKSNLVALH